MSTLLLSLNGEPSFTKVLEGPTANDLSTGLQRDWMFGFVSRAAGSVAAASAAAGAAGVPADVADATAGTDQPAWRWRADGHRQRRPPRPARAPAQSGER